MKQEFLKTKDTHIPDNNTIDNKYQMSDIIIQKKNVDYVNKNLTSAQLQEAVIWSEILGKPICKRRKRSYHSN